MRTNKNKQRIFLAATVALLAMIISYSVFGSMRNQLEDQKKTIAEMQKNANVEINAKAEYVYAYATKDLNSGEIVAENDVDFKGFPIQNYSAIENSSDVVNKILLKNIKKGEIFTSSHIAKISNDNVELREGYRALTLPTESFQGKSKNMISGSYVDIYSTSSDSSWVLEGVRILELEPSNSGGGIVDANTVTFEVPVNYVSDFISNLSKNKLVLVTRNKKEMKIKHYTAKSTDFPVKNSISTKNPMPKIESLPSWSSSMPDLPPPEAPIKAIQSPEASVEVIEANVKTKVTF